MKLRITASVIAALLIVSVLAGCTLLSKNEPDDNSETTVQTTAVEPGEKADYSGLYTEKIDEIRALVKENISDDDYLPEEDMESIFIAAKAYGNSALTEMGYVIKDLNGDEKPELLIVGRDANQGENKGSLIIAAYSAAGDEIKLIFDSLYRSSYSYISGDKFYYSGSSSAFSHAFGTFKLSDDGETLVCSDFYFSDIIEGTEEIGYFRNNTGEWDMNTSRRLDIDSDEFSDMEDNLSKFVTALEYIPLDIDPLSSAGKVKANLSAQYLKDSGVDASDCIALAADDSEYSVDVLITTDAAITDFKLLSLEYKELDNGSFSFDRTVISTVKNVSPATPVVITLSFPGSLPQNGISYTDTDGRTVTYSIAQSGEDGSVQLSEI